MAQGDSQKLDSVIAHVQAAKSAPHRAELELTSARNIANTIQDASMKKRALDLIASAE